MRWRLAVSGVTLACACSIVVAAQERSSTAGAVDRVQPFERLAGPRIEVPEGPDGVAGLLDFCPDRTETCRNYWAYTIHFVRNHTIPLRDKELLILRTAWLSRGDYVWGRHRVMGLDAGLTGAEIQRITQGPGASGWSGFDGVLLRAADEMHTSRFISDDTWNALAERYSQDQLVEVVLIIGNYTQLTMFQNTLGVPLPPDVPGLPEATATR